MDPFQNRRWVILLIMFFIGILFTIRLLYVQVLDDTWGKRAEKITRHETTIHPSRGLIYDRNGKLLVSANQVYDIMVTPNRIGKIDTTLLYDLFNLSKAQFDQKIDNASTGYNVPYKGSIFIEAMAKEEFARIAPLLKQHNGFEAVRNTNRGYPNSVAAHILGYVRKISAEQYKHDQTEGEKYYNQNDYVGITGLEKVYEKELRGERGTALFLRDYAGNAKTGLETIEAIAGKNL